MPETDLIVGSSQWAVLVYLGRRWPLVIPAKRIRATVLPRARPARVQEILVSLRARGLIIYVQQDWDGTQYLSRGWQITPLGNLARRRRPAEREAQPAR